MNALSNTILERPSLFGISAWFGLRREWCVIGLECACGIICVRLGSCLFIVFFFCYLHFNVVSVFWIYIVIGTETTATEPRRLANDSTLIESIHANRMKMSTHCDWVGWIPLLSATSHDRLYITAASDWIDNSIITLDWIGWMMQS